MPVPSWRADSSFCSNLCALAHRQSQKLPNGVADCVSIGGVGAIGELLVCADLLRRGYDVFRSVSPNGPFDVVACSGDRTIRIEVKVCAEYMDGSRVTRKREPDNPFDVIAMVYLNSGSIVYDPSL